MGGFNTYYGPGKSLNTDTSGAGGGPAGGAAGASGSDLTSYLQQQLMARLNAREQERQMALGQNAQDRAIAMKNAEEDRAYMLQQRRAAQPQPSLFGGAGGAGPSFGGGGGGGQMAMRGADSGGGGGDRGGAMRGGGGGNALEQQVRNAELRDRLLALQAKEQGPIMKGLHGPGMIGSAGGQDTMDTNAMNAYQRELYLPQSAGVSYSPGVEARTALNAKNEDAWGAMMYGDRLRTKGQYGGEVGGANSAPQAQTPQGTAPMLTPANASVPGRQLSQEEQLRQRQANARYGR